MILKQPPPAPPLIGGPTMPEPNDRNDPKSEITVRAYRPQDLKAVCALERTSGKEDVLQDGYLKLVLKNTLNYRCYVAQERKGSKTVLVGYALASERRLLSVVIREGHRRKGLATRLFKPLRAWRPITAAVRARDVAAQKWLAKQKLVCVEIRQDAYACPPDDAYLFQPLRVR